MLSYRHAASAGIGAASLCFALGGVSHAQSTPQGSQALETLLSCRTVAEPEARLACYDGIVAELGEDGSEYVMIERSEVEAVERDSFGLNLPSLPRLSLSLFGDGGESLEVTDAGAGQRAASGPAAPAQTVDAAPSMAATGDTAGGADVRITRRDRSGQIERMELAIDRIERSGIDTIRIYTANGQVWEMIDRVGRRPVRASEDSVMAVRRASLGSYLMQIDGRGRAYRVERIR